MKLTRIISALSLTAALTLSSTTARAQEDDLRIATAWEHSFDVNTGILSANFVTFPFSNPIQCTSGPKLNFPELYNIDQPVRVGDNYYFYSFAQQVYDYDAGGFYCYDIEENNLRQIADYGGTPSGTAFSNLCYDYTDGTMYCTDGFMGGYWLGVLDLETGLHRKTCRLKVPLDLNHPDFEDHISTIAINYDGEMYGLTYWGHIVKINKFTGECKVISTMDYNPDTAFMYSSANRLFFDNETGDCYLHLYTYAGQMEIRKVDLATGHSEQFAPIEDEGTLRALYGIYLPFLAAEPSAPAAVSELSVTPADKGECRATLTWTNPTKTFGRGGTLEELDKIEIYRNGELVHTIDNPTIGGRESYTDIPAAPDFYTYRVVGYNSAGRGDRACASNYIGMGIPQMPAEVTATIDGDRVKLAWSMPETGSFDSFIDYSDVVYDIVRYEGVTNPRETTVAEGVPDMEYVDTPDKLGNYMYSITARNNVGKSEAGQSPYTICGPAIRAPYDFSFNDTYSTETWTIIDGNGDGDGWRATQNGPWTFVLSSQFNAFVGYAAMEYLFSPQALLEKGKRYKVTFQAQPGSDKIAEVLAVSFGKTPTPSAQDSVTQFNIVSKQPVNLRANLPEILETGHYHFGFVHRTAVANYSLSLLGVTIAEDHEGYALVSVKDEQGNLLPGATVTAPGLEKAEADKNGKYLLSYLPAGDNEVTASVPGYFDASASVNITEWETSPLDITLRKRPLHTLSGRVIDAAGDPVADASVTLTGYAGYSALTDADGRFSLPGICEAEGYNIAISKNRHLSYNNLTDITADLDLGTVTLADNIRAPRSVNATENSTEATVTWTRPANDVITLRFDDGSGTQLVGLNTGTNESVFGTIFRTPATLHGAQFYIGSMPGNNHWSVQLYVFDLDEEGNPTTDILYQNTYVSVTDDQWNTFTLPTPVEAPRGFYLAISTYGNICIGVDGAGDTEQYPFIPGVNCFSADYTTGKFTYIEDAGVPHNFQMRALASPYDDADMPARSRFLRQAPSAAPRYDGEPLVITKLEEPTADAPAAPARVLEERLRYNVWRFAETDEANAEAWTKVGDALQGESFTDSDWSTQQKGIYKYAVEAIYADGVTSPATVSDIVGRDMHTDLTINLFTNTPENLCSGAKLSMTSSDTRFHYKAEADESGRIRLPYTWKGVYSLHITKEGFEPWQTQLELADEPSYTLTATLKQSKHTPVGLRVVDDGYTDRRTLAWNIPELLKESFEQNQGHPVFTIASPGYLGWSYLDGDGAPTGGLNYVWPNQFEPISWMTFNPDMTTPSMLADNLMPHAVDGDQFILAVSSGDVANNDWIISPRLFFTEPFKMQFEASGWNPEAASETIEIGYSSTDTDPASFTWYSPLQLDAQTWTQYIANFPAEARYVAIRYVSSGLYMAMIDNIKIGNPEHIQNDNWGYYYPTYVVPQGPATYEIFLNGNKLGTTELNNYELTDLPNGHYLAAVRSIYDSGYSDMASAEFDITMSGVENFTLPASAITLKGRTLTVTGTHDRVELLTPTGLSIPLRGNGDYDLSAILPGIYLVRVSLGTQSTVRKIVLQ